MFQELFYSQLALHPFLIGDEYYSNSKSNSRWGGALGRAYMLIIVHFHFI